MSVLSLGKRGKRHAVREDLKLGAIARVLFFHWRLLAAGTLVAGLGALVFFSSQSRVYEASLLLELDIKKLNLLGQAANSDRADKDDFNIDNEIVFLTSGLLLSKVAQRLGLAGDPEFFPLARGPGEERDRFVGLEAEEADAGAEKATDNLHVNATLTASLLEHLDVGQIGGSNVVSLKVSSIDPVKAARIANALAAIYLEHRREVRRQSEDQAMRIIDTRIRELRGELAGLEGQILDYKMENRIEDFDGHGSEARSVSVQRAELTTQLALVKADLAQSKARRQQSSAKIDPRDADGAPIALTSPVMSELKVAETSLLRRLAQLSSEFGPRHPLMVNARGELDIIRRRMQDETRKVQGVLNNDVAVNLARASELEAQLDVLDVKSAGQQQAHAGLLVLKQRSQSITTLLGQFIEQRQVLEQRRDFVEGPARIMSPAQVPFRHTYPSIGSFSLMAALAGLMTAGLGVFFYDRWVSDFGFVTLDQLRDFEVPALGVVPVVDERETGGLAIEDYAIQHPQSAVAEAFQRIRTRLLNLDVAEAHFGQILLVMSSLPMEGKTSTSVILARQAAMAGVRTLLIDADLRRPRVHDVLDTDNRIGLCEVLTGKTGDEQIIHQDSRTPLEFLSAGGFTASPADLFRSEQMAALISHLRRHFGLIVIDSPPLGAVVDSLVLSTHADRCVFVARWRATMRSTIMSNLSQLRDIDAPLAGLVLSRVDTLSHRKYGDTDLGQLYGHYQHNQAAA